MAMPTHSPLPEEEEATLVISLLNRMTMLSSLKRRRKWKSCPHTPLSQKRRRPPPLSLF